VSSRGSTWLLSSSSIASEIFEIDEGETNDQAKFNSFSPYPHHDPAWVWRATADIEAEPEPYPARMDDARRLDDQYHRYLIHLQLSPICGYVGNFATMSATVAAVDCSTFPFLGPGPYGNTVCYAASAPALTAASGSLFVAPEKLSIYFDDEGSPIQNGQSFIVDLVFSETDQSDVLAQFDLVGTALDGAINGTWDCDSGMMPCGGLGGDILCLASSAMRRAPRC
jgi:hypothetical protein